MHLGCFLGVSTMVSLLTGCASGRLGSLSDAADRALTDARPERVFENGILYKPEPAGEHPPSVRLAPLLLQEVSTTDGTSNDGAFTVYATEAEVLLGPSRHLQLTYVWSLRSGPSAVQGFRMTLNSSGAPVIWECLPEPNGVQVIFVARSIEDAAHRHYGAPLPGRRYAVEPALDSLPKVVVAGVVDDGPMPMGPIVYLDASGKISTVLCRCSPAQARNVSATARYFLQPVDKLSDAALPGILALTEDQVRWLPSPTATAIRVLRLPKRL
jgi:hypothetical protein